jgi:hypothetical protein
MQRKVQGSHCSIMPHMCRKDAYSSLGEVVVVVAERRTSIDKRVHVC